MPDPEPHDRLLAFGNQLMEVHILLRDELADLRDNVDAYFAGRGGPPRDLRTHCLAFCAGLRRHHTGEDQEAFPEILTHFPELHGLIVQLRTDHNRIEWTMHNLEKLLQELPDEPSPADATRFRAELDSMTAIMETHFRYEEKKLRSVLDSLDIPRWRTDPPAFLRYTFPDDALE
ncbi:hemerythrin domain-containing protein [Actinoplanes sp. NPDC049681]|uniref:hemerythrin domain-containing protein n=1 Tax=Actinoplanes sp. NPDC049681 TaxID=3363905 RepID=UPI0037B7EAAF